MMSTWDVINIITIIGVILAPITTFVFIAMGLFNVSSAMRRQHLESQILAQQNSHKDTLLAYLLSQMLKGQGFTAKQDFAEYNPNADFYAPSSSSVPALSNARAELKNSQAAPIYRNSGFWIGLLSGLCVFLTVMLIMVA